MDQGPAPSSRSPGAAATGPVRCASVSSPDLRTDADDDFAAEDAPSATGGALVDESRRVLVHLLQGPFLDGRRDGARYAQLLRDRSAIEARLADQFLELIVDDDAQVAFVRQSEEDPDAPKLLRRLTGLDRKSTRLNSSHVAISYAVF